MKSMKLLVLASCWVAGAASAQWQWLDQSGRKVFSDRPPPASVPDKNILKQPRGTGSNTSVAAAPAAVSSAPAPASAAKPGDGVDKALQEKKKQATDAEAAKRKAEEERVAQAQGESCARARQAKVGMDSGMRIARTNEKGEREFMDDAARAAEAQRVQSVIDSDCK